MGKSLKKMSNIDLLIDLYKDPERKPILQIFREIIILAFYHYEFPRYYFSRYLFKKEITNIKDFIPNKFLAFDLKDCFINEDVIEVLENKLYFSFFYSQFNISMPKIYMYNHNKMFVENNTIYPINTSHDFNQHLKNFFKKNPNQDSIIIKKMYWSYGGDQIFKVFKNEPMENEEKIGQIYSDVIKEGYIFQETVVQHKELNLINSSCLNTIRIDTFIDNYGKVNIISAYIRMSTNNSHVDNISSGGCYIGVDLEKGRLKKYGYMPFIRTGVKLLTRHPITNIVFDNYKLPYFKEVKELIIKTAGIVPGLRLIGWDVAIGDNGPVLIEGNSRYLAANNDLTFGGFGSNEVYKKMLKEFNKIKK